MNSACWTSNFRFVMTLGRQELQWKWDISYQLDLHFCIYLVMGRYIHMNIHVLHQWPWLRTPRSRFLRVIFKSHILSNIKIKKARKKENMPLKMLVSNRNLLFQVYFQGQAVSFREGSCEKSCCSWRNSNLGLVWRSRTKKNGLKEKHVTTILGILGPAVFISNCAGQEEYMYIYI